MPMVEQSRDSKPLIPGSILWVGQKNEPSLLLLYDYQLGFLVHPIWDLNHHLWDNTCAVIPVELEGAKLHRRCIQAIKYTHLALCPDAADHI